MPSAPACPGDQIVRSSHHREQDDVHFQRVNVRSVEAVRAIPVFLALPDTPETPIARRHAVYVSLGRVDEHAQRRLDHEAFAYVLQILFGERPIVQPFDHTSGRARLGNAPLSRTCSGLRTYRPHVPADGPGASYPRQIGLLLVFRILVIRIVAQFRKTLDEGRHVIQELPVPVDLKIQPSADLSIGGLLHPFDQVPYVARHRHERHEGAGLRRRTGGVQNRQNPAAETGHLLRPGLAKAHSRRAHFLPERPFLPSVEVGEPDGLICFGPGCQGRYAVLHHQGTATDRRAQNAEFVPRQVFATIRPRADAFVRCGNALPVERLLHVKLQHVGSRDRIR